MDVSHDNKGSQKNQGVESKNNFAPMSQPFNTHSIPLPRTFEGKLYYGAEDVAKIIGVDRTTVFHWCECRLFYLLN